MSPHHLAISFPQVPRILFCKIITVCYTIKIYLNLAQKGKTATDQTHTKIFGQRGPHIFVHLGRKIKNKHWIGFKLQSYTDYNETEKVGMWNW